jgi:hypothetical protein
MAGAVVENWNNSEYTCCNYCDADASFDMDHPEFEMDANEYPCTHAPDCPVLEAKEICK